MTDTDAAIHLGITKELLYAYVRNAPKKCKGDSRRLSSIVIEGQNYFEKEELDSFNAYLKEPWSDSASQRPPIPSYIKDYLKIEIQGKCPISGIGYPLEDAHISAYCESQNHHHHNIIRISGDVHTKIDSGIISRDILSQTKNNLIRNLKQTLKENTQLKRSTFDVPNPNPFYIGREELIRDLVCAMSDTQLVVIEGIGGIGKSQLLIQAINSTVEYYNPVVWIDIEQVETFADFLMLFSNAIYEYYKVSFSDSGFDVLQDIQITFVLDSLEKLLINEKDDIEDFIIELLSKCPTIQLLITSQIDLSLLDWPLKVFKLQGLNKEESVSLIYTLLDEDFELEHSETNWILEFSNGHPLTLKLISTLIKYHHSIPRVIQLLKKSEKVQHPTRQKHNKSTSLSVCLNTIYDILNDDQKEILHFLRFYPIGLKLEWLEFKFKEKLSFTEIAELQQFFFIDRIENSQNVECLIIPNPIRPFLNEKLETAEINYATEKEAINIIILEAIFTDDFYIESNLAGDPSYGIIRMKNEIPNLLLALNIAQKRSHYFEKEEDLINRNIYLEFTSKISYALGKFCFVTSDYEKGILFAKAGIDASMKLEDFRNVSLQYLYLAQIQCRLIDIQGLQETTNLSNYLMNQVDDNLIRIHSFWINGHLNFQLKEYNNSRNNYGKAISILEELISKNKENTASDFGNLMILNMEFAKTYEFEKKYEDAIPIYKNITNTLLGQLELIDCVGNVGSLYHHYAHCLCKSGNIKEGIKYYNLSIDKFHDVGLFEYLANSIQDLGNLIEDFPNVINYPTLNYQVLLLSLRSVTNQLLNSRVGKKNLDEFPLEFVGKVLEITKAISFSQYLDVLCEWVSELLEEISLDLSKPSYFGALLNLAHCVGGVDD